MPMYFPDLKSVQSLAASMARNREDKKYTGIYPETEADLPEARKQLGKYLRDKWNDEVAALEVELAVTAEDYDEKMTEAIQKAIREKKAYFFGHYTG